MGMNGIAVAAAAAKAGFGGNNLVTAVAVAYGESTWDPTSSNACCVGLWQINRNHTAIINKHGGPAKMTDPRANAAMAYDLWRSAGGWCTSGKAPNCNPWQAYGTDNAGKTWKSKLSDAAYAVAQMRQMQVKLGSLDAVYDNAMATNPISSAIGSGVDAAGNAIGSAADAAQSIAQGVTTGVNVLNRLGAWIGNSQNWFRVANVAVGGIVILVGLNMLVSAELKGPAMQLIGAVNPVGKAGKVAKVASTAGS